MFPFNAEVRYNDFVELHDLTGTPRKVIRIKKMNIETATTIKKIANGAICDLKKRTMKFAKQNVRDIFEHYNNKENIDIEEVKEAFWQSLDSKTIKELTRRLCLLKETMDDIESELYFERRITAAIKIANRDHGAWITREQIIKAAKGDRLFNFTKIAAECAAGCKK